MTLLTFVSCTSSWWERMSGFRKYIRFPLRLILSLRGRQQNLSLGLNPVDNAEPCFPHDTIVGSHLCGECVKSNEPDAGHKLLSIWWLIEQVCSLIKECQVYRILPSASILRQFVSILLTVLQLIQVPLSWTGDHPSKDLRLCLSTTRLLYFWKFGSNSAFLRWQRSIKVAKWTFFLSLCAPRITSFFTLNFVQLPAWIRFELLPFLVHCCFRIRHCHRLRHWNELVHQIVMSHRMCVGVCVVMCIVVLCVVADVCCSAVLRLLWLWLMLCVNVCHCVLLSAIVCWCVWVGVWCWALLLCVSVVCFCCVLFVCCCWCVVADVVLCGVVVLLSCVAVGCYFYVLLLCRCCVLCRCVCVLCRWCVVLCFVLCRCSLLKNNYCQRGWHKQRTCSSIFVDKMCVFLTRPKKVTFPLTNGETPKLVVGFLLDKDTFLKQNMEIVKDFVEQNYNNNDKPCKSSRILSLKTKTLHIFNEYAFVIFSNFFIFCFFHVFSLFFFLDATKRKNGRELPTEKLSILFWKFDFWASVDKG